MKTLVIPVLSTVFSVAAVLAAAIWLGGPRQPPAMPGINDPFKHIDYSDLPVVERFAARDGARLAYRHYPYRGILKGSVTLVHGSSARGESMHPMARGFAIAGYEVYALDIRGHGQSGVKGNIAYVGQLEDDLADFVKEVRPRAPATLAGFSSGGGFVLRFAGDSRKSLFANYLLLSPFLGQDAPNYRPDSGGWVSVGMPRAVAISILRGVGIRLFDRLPVVRFALNEQARKILTPEYSFALAQNFRPQADFRANIRSALQPIAVVAGMEDEAFYTDRLPTLFGVDGGKTPVTLVPGTNHIGLTLNGTAIRTEVDTVEKMNRQRRW